MNRVGLTIEEIAATEFARPANTDVYAANDVLCNSTSAPTVLTFENCSGEKGAGGYIAKARIFTDSATGLLGTQFRLNLFHTAPTPVNDNAQYPLLYANAVNRIGYLDFGPLETGGTGSNSSAALWIDIPLQYRCAQASRNLSGILVVRVVGAAPVSGQKFRVFLGVEKH